MKKKVILLTPEQLEYLQKFRDHHTYNSQTQLFYHGQIPMAAYVLIEGRIDLKNARDKIIKECSPTALIGFQQLCNREPFKYTAEIHPGSKVLIIDRSTAGEILEDMEPNYLDLELLDIVS